MDIKIIVIQIFLQYIVKFSPNILKLKRKIIFQNINIILLKRLEIKFQMYHFMIILNYNENEDSIIQSIFV